MAVFTTFSDAALKRYLVMFDVGELASYAPIEGGIENSNYFVNLTHDDEPIEFVLTITEDLSFDEVPFFNELLSQLDRAGLPVPVAQQTLDGMKSTIFCGKPAWLFARLPGSHPMNVSTDKCHTIGQALARLHDAAQKTRYSRDNPYHAAWARQVFEAQQHKLATADRQLLADLVNEYESLTALADLPRGIVHGDLFRDNALFDGERLTGIIDFYHACDDFLVQDIAITMNDWCTDADGQVDADRADALLAGYESARPLTEAERQWLPAFQRVGAMRFILTRLISGGDDAPLKDPEEFLRIARHLAEG